MVEKLRDASLPDAREAEHTPTPWEAKFTHGIKADAYRIYSKEHPEWCICMGPNWLEEHSTENMANARFIVIACNSHAQLIAALEAQTDLIEWAQEYLKQYIDPGDMRIQNEKAVVSALLNLLDSPKQRDAKDKTVTALAFVENGGE